MNLTPWSRSQQAAGLITLAAMLLAFVLDNSPAAEWYEVVHHRQVMVQVGTFAIDKPLILWINDGLMVFFFLLIALELKREILDGQLSTAKSIATPAFAALGGMAAPTLIYAAFNASDPVAMRGDAGLSGHGGYIDIQHSLVQSRLEKEPPFSWCTASRKCRRPCVNTCVEQHIIELK